MRGNFAMLPIVQWSCSVPGVRRSPRGRQSGAQLMTGGRSSPPTLGHEVYYGPVTPVSPHVFGLGLGL